MEKELYNNKTMSIYDLKDLLEQFPLNLLYDYFELKQINQNKQIFFKDVNKVTSTENSKLKFYLENENIEMRL